MGSVCDQSGAAVPDATVTTTPAETNTTTATKTDNDGHHVTTPLKIGHYSVGVQAPGFESEDRSNTTLGAQDRVVRGNLNNFMLDGIDSNSDNKSGIVLYANVDAVEEFKVQTSSYSAELVVAGAPLSIRPSSREAISSILRTDKFSSD